MRTSTQLRPLAAMFAIAVIVALALAMVPAWGAVTTGCSGRAVTYDAQGRMVDRATAPGPGGTEQNPLAMDPDGRIDWSGKTESVITNGAWEVSTIGLSFDGTMDNSDKKQAYSGTLTLGDDNPAVSLPLKFLLTGESVLRVDGNLTGDGGTCTGYGYITGVSGAAFTPMWWTALVMLIVGIALMLQTMFGTTTSAEVAAATQQAIDEGALDEFLPKAGSGAGSGGGS
jgi:hypothetical protein